MLLGLADVWMRKGDSKHADEALARAMDLSAASDSQGRARIYALRAVSEKRRGAFDAAIRDALAALDLVQGGAEGDLDDELGCLNLLGNIYSDLGRFDRARSYYEKALRANVKRYPVRLTESLNGIGFALQWGGDLPGAVRSYVEALHFSCGSGAPERTLHYTDADGRAQELACAVTGNTGVALSSVGQIQTELGRPQVGLPSLLEALAIRRQGGGENKTDIARSLLDLGSAYRDLGDDDRALSTFREGLALSQEAEDIGLQTAFLYRWAILDRNRGRNREALEKMETALHFVEEVRNGVSNPDQRISFLASKRQYYELLIDLLLRLHEAQPGGAAYPQQALFACEMAKARSLLDFLRSGRIRLGGPELDELRQHEQDLEAQRAFLHAELRRLGGHPSREDVTVALLQRELAENSAQSLAVADEIRTRFPRYAEVSDPRPLNPSSIQAQVLEADTALVEYLVGADSTYLFVLTREKLAAYRLPLGVAELARQVATLRSFLDTPQEELAQAYLDQGYALYRQLLAPAASVLARKRTFLIAADGPLLKLPFEALLIEHRKLDGRTTFRNLPYLFLQHPLA
ncbi:MAG TPA: tetratricopeptide repeat protein, partial [Thermoanaerobaculia bacterium]